MATSPFERLRAAYQEAHAAALERHAGDREATMAVEQVVHHAVRFFLGAIRWTEVSAKVTAARRAKETAELALAGAALAELVKREMQAKERARG